MACRFSHQYTEVRFASFLSGGFPTMAVINPPERKLAKRISVQYLANFVYQTVSVCSYFCAWVWEFVCNHVQPHVYECAYVQNCY